MQTRALKNINKNVYPSIFHHNIVVEYKECLFSIYTSFSCIIYLIWNNLDIYVSFQWLAIFHTTPWSTYTKVYINSGDFNSGDFKNEISFPFRILTDPNFKFAKGFTYVSSFKFIHLVLKVLKLIIKELFSGLTRRGV